MKIKVSKIMEDVSEAPLMLIPDDEPILINDEPLSFSKDDLVDDDFSIGDIVSTTLTDKEISESRQHIEALIADEQEAINQYNAFIECVNSSESDIKYLENTGVINIVRDIIKEENKHIGQLQHIIKLINPDSDSVREGELEAAEQLAEYSQAEETGEILHPFFNATPSQGVETINPQRNQMTMVDGIKKLPVQTFNFQDSKMSTNKSEEDSCSLDDYCSVANVDDEF